MFTLGKTTRNMGAVALGAAVLIGLAPMGSASATTPQLASGGSAYGPCYYNPIPCNSAQQGKNNPYANPPLPNSAPNKNVHILPPPAR